MCGRVSQGVFESDAKREACDTLVEKEKGGEGGGEGAMGDSQGVADRGSWFKGGV